MNDRLRRLRRNEQGSVTIEFALWIPVLAIWLVFSVAVFNAYATRNQTAKAANTLSDIVSRKDRMNATAFAELYDLQDKLLPLAHAGHELRITSVRFLRDNPISEEREYVVGWSFASANLQPLTAENFPFEDLPVMAETDTIVYTEVRVPWTPFSALSGMPDYTWSFAAANRPRFVPAIQLSAVQ